MNYKSSFILVLLVTCKLSEGGFLFVPSSVTISNHIGYGISVIVHCRSEDDDFGDVILYDGKKMSWKFTNYETRIWCDIFKERYQWWLKDVQLFFDGNYGFNPVWSIRKDGLYRWEGKILGFIFTGDSTKWVKEYWADDLWKH
ncbi:hypothetical protein FRX31_014755 [Thalictrum thalictroides]|uniref:S-protein homolog n=1 Tax=Thalictrum thalictroides TaxID=46969 RepID=A0A7J6WGW6_THATH|nr:hypothetical protein FRX31_014755 [Thalictrum thalictroides]